jgi:UDP-N-acetylglucosamine:LPS N-acetylglucosamine transferase
MPHAIKVLAVASAGGHWAQLQRLTPAFEGCETVFVSTMDPGLSDANARVYVVPNAHRSTKLNVLKLLGAMLRITLAERPDVVISTGAAPGYIALRCGRLIGARTVWVDSIANVDQLSMSGRLAQRVADLCLTQWPHLARPKGPFFAGRVM